MSTHIQPYQEDPINTDHLLELTGLTLLDFGTDWCGHCQFAAPLVLQALGDQTIRHIKRADGKGKNW